MDYPNWFACYADEFFARHLRHLAGKPDLLVMQIGVFTGDASLWLLQNVLTGEGSVLVDVDTWQGSDEPEHEPFDWTDVHETYLSKTLPVGVAEQVVHYGTSADYFSRPRLRNFDFIYIDGDHTAPGVLADAVHAFDLLKPGGLMAFDDYQWKPYPEAPAHLAPAMAIDTFTACYQDRLEIIEAGLQVWVRKS